jgi:hypothetical protein
MPEFISCKLNVSNRLYTFINGYNNRTYLNYSIYKDIKLGYSQIYLNLPKIGSILDISSLQNNPKIASLEDIFI